MDLTFVLKECHISLKLELEWSQKLPEVSQQHPNSDRFFFFFP